MPFAVTHVLIPIVIADYIRDHFVKNKKKWHNKIIFAIGIGGLLPDLDVPLGWIVQLFTGVNYSIFHKTFTHSIFFLGIFLAVIVIFELLKKHEYLKYSFMLFFGVASHLVFDALAREIPLWWWFNPNSLKVGLNILPYGSAGTSFMVGLDAIILLLWLWHEEKYHRISDYL